MDKADNRLNQKKKIKLIRRNFSASGIFGFFLTSLCFILAGKSSNQNIVIIDGIFCLVFSFDCFLSIYLLKKRNPLVFVFLPLFLAVAAVYGFIYERPLIFIFIILGSVLILQVSQIRELLNDSPQ